MFVALGHAREATVCVVMKVSVAIATFNGERFIGDQLRSIADQTVLPDEVVVSDDGSTDRTVDEIRAFAQSAPFELRLLEGPRDGIAANFATAIDECLGDILFLADQDDQWFPSKVERVLAAFEDPSCSLVVHDATLADESLRPADQTLLERHRLLGLSPDTHIKGCCTAVRRELAALATPFPDGVSHDRFLHALAAELDGRKTIDQPLMLYRIHGANSSDYAVNSLAVINRRHIARLRVRSLRRRIRPAAGAHVSTAEVRALARERLSLPLEPSQGAT